MRLRFLWIVAPCVSYVGIQACGGTGSSQDAAGDGKGGNPSAGGSGGTATSGGEGGAGRSGGTSGGGGAPAPTEEQAICQANGPGALCGTGKVCSSEKVCVRGCFIQGQTVTKHFTNPVNACEACQPEVDPLAWTTARAWPNPQTNEGPKPACSFLSMRGECVQNACRSCQNDANCDEPLVPNTTGTTVDLLAVGGDGDEIYAVGKGGTILKKDLGGASWSLQPSPVAEDLYALCVYKPANKPVSIHIVGANGTVLGLDNSAWKKYTSPTAKNLFACWEGAQGLYVVGEQGTIVRYDSAIKHTVETSPSHETLYSVVSTNTPGEAYAVGGAGIILHRDPQSGQWRAEPSNTRVTLRAVRYLANAAPLLAIGDQNTILTKSDRGRDENLWLSKDTKAVEPYDFIAQAPVLVSYAGHAHAMIGAGKSQDALFIINPSARELSLMPKYKLGTSYKRFTQLAVVANAVSEQVYVVGPQGLILSLKLITDGLEKLRCAHGEENDKGRLCWRGCMLRIL